MTNSLLVTTGTFAPAFAGNRQEDAMELFDKLTDLLHEDLNRIKGSKPYFEKEEPDAVRHVLGSKSLSVSYRQVFLL